MEPSIHIRALDLRCPPRLSAEGRRRLAAIATRELPAALARAVSSFDDGRLIFVRRLDVRAPLRGESGPAAAARWAEAIAAALRDARGDVVVFERPLDALVALVEAVLGPGRGAGLGRWPWVPGVLEAIRAELSSLPALDGRSHAFTAAPPLPVPAGGGAAPEPCAAIEWALITAGALLPSLVGRLDERGLAGPALGEISRSVAAGIVERLIDRGDGSGHGRDDRGSIDPSVARVAAAIAGWPSPAAADPRNQLLLAALVLAERPSLRGTPALASVRALAARGIDGGFGPVAAETAGDAADAAADGGAGSIAGPVAAVSASSPAPAVQDLSEIRTPARTPAGTETAFGGLLFLLDPLRRLEVPDAILDEPALASEPGLPALLYGIVCRLVPEAWADPCALALTEDGAPQAPPTAPTPDRLAAIERAAARIADAAARLPAVHHAADVIDAATLAAAVPLATPPPWLDRFCVDAAAHVAAHLRARLGSDQPLAALARRLAARPGSITVTRTHLDVTLDLADVDLDVRRAALDVDPGWVPFLGRIVSFHYVSPSQHRAG